MLELGARTRICGENFNGRHGPRRRPARHRPLLHLGRAAGLCRGRRTSDVNPWQGWTLNNTGADVTLDPLLTPAGAATIRVAGGRLTVAAGGRTLLETDARGRMTHVVLGETGRSLVIPDQPAPGARIALPDVPRERLEAIALDGRQMLPDDGPGVSVVLPETTGGTLVVRLKS